MYSHIRPIIISFISLVVISCGGGGGGTPAATNAAPVFSSGVSFSITSSTAVTGYTAVASDSDGDTVSFSISGGADQSSFAINSSTGVLRFNTAPNFASPTDSDTNNTYIVDVSASDGTDSVTQTVTITILNTAPVFTSGTSFNMDEGLTLTGYTATATDADGQTVTFSIELIGETDQASFSIDSNTGVMSFIAPPDYDNPTDSDTNNTYVVEVTATDGTATVTQSVTITVTDATPPTVSSTTPASAATGVDRDVVITATFSEDMFATTIDGSSFTLANTGSVAGTVSFNGATNVATIAQTRALALLTSHTATLSTAITDLAGNALASTSWSFTTADGAWAGATLNEIDDTSAAIDPQVSFDNNGNAISVWTQGSPTSIYANRFDASTGTWSGAALIESASGAASAPQIAFDTSGNAFAIWVQNDGTRFSIYTNRYDAGTNTWAGAELIEVGSDGGAFSPQISFDASGNAIAVWRQFSGATFSIFANRYDATTSAWLGETLLENDDSGAADLPQIAMDTSGNAFAVWQQTDVNGFTNAYVNRYDLATNTWSGATTLDAIDGAASAAQVATDSNGNAIAVWVQVDGVRFSIYSSRYVSATDTWTSAILLELTQDGGAFSPQIAIDSNGNAITVWRQFVGSRFSIYSNRYVAATETWAGAIVLELDDSGPADLPQVGIDSLGNAIAVWKQTDALGLTNIYANRYVAGTTNAWSGAALIETDDTGDADTPQVSVDNRGSAFAIWSHFDGARNNIQVNRFE